MEFVKILSGVASKNITEKMMRQAMDWKKMFATHACDDGLLPWMSKEPCESMERGEQPHWKMDRLEHKLSKRR